MSPNARQYTRYSSVHSVYTRIDYFIIFSRDSSRIIDSEIDLSDHPEENFTAQSLLLYGYGAVKELNESSHFSLVVVFFGLKHFSFVSPKIP